MGHSIKLAASRRRLLAGLAAALVLPFAQSATAARGAVRGTAHIPERLP